MNKATTFPIELMPRLKRNLNEEELSIILNNSNASMALKNSYIQKALINKQISVEDLINLSDIVVKALEYPTIKRCLTNKIHFFFSKINLQEVLKIKTEEEFVFLLKKYTKNLKKNPLSIFMVPFEIHDEMHELKQSILRKKE